VSKSSKIHPRHLARENAVQFLYQCESEKIFHFPEAQFREFCDHHNLEAEISQVMKTLAKGTMENLTEIDGKISAASKNWSIDRMAATDRIVLRLATYELLEAVVPNDVVLNEAIDIAKKFGSNNSGRFVNGILDTIAKG